MTNLDASITEKTLIAQDSFQSEIGRIVDRVLYIAHASYRDYVSLVPRPFKRRRKGLVHTARACAGVSVATGRVTIVIVRGFCMTYSFMDNKRGVYDSIRLPHIFLGSHFSEKVARNL